MHVRCSMSRFLTMQSAAAASCTASVRLEHGTYAACAWRHGVPETRRRHGVINDLLVELSTGFWTGLSNLLVPFRKMLTPSSSTVKLGLFGMVCRPNTSLAV